MKTHVLIQSIGAWLDKLSQHGFKSSICIMITTNGANIHVTGELHLQVWGEYALVCPIRLIIIRHVGAFLHKLDQVKLWNFDAN